jgi:RNA polymerase sigma-70 factor (ECF subfamily)
VGGVKAALNRGRSKLERLPERAASRPRTTPELSQLLHRYVERFNRRDWDGLRELISADACLQVADRFAGRVIDSPYFGNYERLTTPWRMAAGEVDGELAVIIMQPDMDRWAPKAFVRFDISNHQIVRIADYAHCPWILSAATSVIFSELS